MDHDHDDDYERDTVFIRIHSQVYYFIFFSIHGFITLYSIVLDQGNGLCMIFYFPRIDALRGRVVDKHNILQHMI